METVGKWQITYRLARSSGRNIPSECWVGKSVSAPFQEPISSVERVIKANKKTREDNCHPETRA